MNHKVYLILSGLLFGLVSLGHILRVMFNWSLEVGGWTAPMWASWIALFIAAALCVWAISLATK